MAATGVSVIPPLSDRPIKNTVVLFDVDGTLTLARQDVHPSMLALLSELRHKVAIGFVGGSDLSKQQEQLGIDGVNVTSLFDFCFSENGLTAFRMAQPLAAQTFINWIGEEKYKTLVNWILHYIADLDIPKKRGTFVEFRNGMINVSPVGRNATSKVERDEYEKYDLANNVRKDMIEAMKKQFPDSGLTYSIGGQISFDVFPTGWDKTYCLRHLKAEADRPDGQEFTTIHFFGDKTFKGGNDYEMYEDPSTTGHSVKSPKDTAAELKQLFGLSTVYTDPRDP